MDIRRWLDEAAEAEAPRDAPQALDREFFHRWERPKPVFNKQSAPKRSKSDSSLLDPQPQSHRAPPARPNPPTEEPSDASACSETSHPSHGESIESESSSQRYARKPRHKTRPDRYEPSSKHVGERRKHIHRSRKGESKKSRRKTKRKKGDKQDSGMSHVFNAKNVSKDRLTLKPREQLGIFNKGKTSTALRGRGCELPDLVFSEMKFLQKEKDQPDTGVPDEPPKKKRKKDRAQTKEGEISAFFTSVRPALAEKDNNITRKHVQRPASAKATLRERERAQSTKSSGVLPTIENPGKASYLGFGGRGPRHESTGYVSWSDSVRDSGLVPPRANPVSMVPRTQHGLPSALVDKATATADDEIFTRPAPPSRSKQRTNGSTERFRISSIGTSCNRASRSHSYPQQSSSPRKVNLVDRAAKFRSTKSVASASSMPPFVSEHTAAEHDHDRPTILLGGDGPRGNESPDMINGPTRTHAVESNGCCTIEPELSSDLGQVIQQCNRTFQERRQAPAPDHRYSGRRTSQAKMLCKEHNLNHHPEAHRTTTVRFPGVDSLRVPNFPGTSVYEHQAGRQQLPPQNTYYDAGPMEVPLPDEHLYLDEEDDLVLDDGTWNVYPEDKILHEYGPEAQTDDMDDMASEDIRPLASENSVVAPGFWRPNKLY
ncbi:hypothetical protein EK21DRAFT_53548 [Setomelanomma holmii]|uniref:Uncharacterized protein n=1 Tax=Setomelanomma holmii TaxID=210430 RepID=A0A9P4LSU1_9PLEO|nr:hypothetical protein EK21DRAFT_53548 [Setomelanomma holmii]